MILFDADMSSKSSIFAFFGTLWSHFRTANQVADSVREKVINISNTDRADCPLWPISQRVTRI